VSALLWDHLNRIDPSCFGGGNESKRERDFSASIGTILLIECILLAWLYSAHKIRKTINEHSRFRLGTGFDLLIKGVIPPGSCPNSNHTPIEREVTS
jgi:hypothetical protein